VRVLVLGGGGQVASAVVAAAPAHHRVAARTRAELDIGDERAVVRALAETGSEWVVNAAAYTAVDLAEDQPAQAAAVNAGTPLPVTPSPASTPGSSPSSTSAEPSSTPSSVTPSVSQIEALAPPLGFTAGKSRTGEYFVRCVPKRLPIRAPRHRGL